MSAWEFLREKPPGREDSGAWGHGQPALLQTVCVRILGLRFCLHLYHVLLTKKGLESL